MGLPETSPINYFASPWAILSCVNLLILVNALLCIAIVGVTRLSIIPVLVTAGAAMADGLDWYAWGSKGSYSLPARVKAASFAYVGWTIREIGCMFYSYFILERILKSWQRKVFLAFFWTFLSTTFVVRVVTCVYSVFTMLSKEELLRWTTVVNRLSTVMFTTTAATEVTSAVFLIYTFNRARKNAAKYGMRQKVGFFRQLLLSSELRVATLASIGIIRAGVMNSKAKVLLASQFDTLAIVMQEMFPVLLIMDQFATRLAKLEGNAAKSLSSSSGANSDGAGHGSGAESPNLNRRHIRPTANPAIDTLDENFRAYMGAGTKAEHMLTEKEEALHP